MGRKGGTETISAVLLAFLGERVWKQSELARHVGVERKTLVKVLTDLQHAHVPLEREEEHPHVYWSVPPSWFPGAVAFQGEAIVDLVRLLRRTPKSKRRDRLVHAIAESASGLRLDVDDSTIVTRTLGPEDEEHLLVLQEAAEKRAVVHAYYYTLSRGDLSWRDISPQRLFFDRGRFLGVCHNSDTLKWFRFDGVVSVRLDRTQEYRSATDVAIERKVAESLDGFHSGDPPTRCVFRVRLPEARSFRKQLNAPFEVEERDGEMVFTVKTSGVIALARAPSAQGTRCTLDRRVGRQQAARSESTPTILADTEPARSSRSQRTPAVLAQRQGSGLFTSRLGTNAIRVRPTYNGPPDLRNVGPSSKRPGTLRIAPTCLPWDCRLVFHRSVQRSKAWSV